MKIRSSTPPAGSRRAFVAGLGALAVTSPLCGASAAALGPIEQPKLRIATSVRAMSFLPVYVAAARTWKQQGLDVELLAFRGDAEASQALAGGSIDISVQSLNGLIDVISAGQPIMGFYAGFHMADFAWLAAPSVKHWANLKGKTMGVSTFGSLTDALTRYALHRNHLDPEKDVQIEQVGGTVSALQALESGRIAGAILSPPFIWRATAAGMNEIGTQARDVSPQWPKHLFMTKKSFMDANPNTLRAVLRGHVAALRLARADRAAAVAVMEKTLKISADDAQRAYALEMPWYDERGSLPEKSMPTFWKITVEMGDVKSPWPESKYLDRRFIDSFKQWAPA